MGWRHASCCPRRSPSPPPCADARRGLVPSGTRRAAVCPHFPPGSPPHAVTAPLSLRVAPLAPNPGYCQPARSAAPLFPPTARRLSVSSLPPSPLLPDGLPSSVPPPPLPGSRPAHLLPCGIAASVSDSLCPRFPLSSLPDGLPPLSPTLCAVASLSPLAGWAAASASDSLCPRFPLSSCRMGCCLCLRPPRSPPLCAVAAPSPHAGWDVVLGAAERAGRCYPRFGAERRHCHASAGRGSAPRRPGGGARRPPSGRAAEPARSAARAISGHQPPHSALYPRAPPAWGWS